MTSGTSFSAPLVTGAIARTLATYSTMNQGQAQHLLSGAFRTNGVLSAVPAGTVNRLLWIPGSDQALDQNPIHPLDTNTDGFVSALDALMVINFLNAGGGAPVPGVPFIDVNGDGVITAIDALVVINYLNAT